ncbi:MAG: V-type ATP synthase subunit I [Candidatus Woesearchaeota archaeon]
MLKPERMAKVRIVCTKEHLRRIVKELHNMKVLHIVEHRKDDALDIGTPLEEAQRLSEIIIKIRSIISYLDLANFKPSEEDYEEFVAKKGTCDLKSIGNAAKEVHEQIVERLNREKELNAEIQRLTRLAEDMEMLSALNLEPTTFRDSKVISSFFGTIGSLVGFEKEIKQNIKKFSLHTAEVKGKQAVALFVKNEDKQKALQFLGSRNFTEIKIDATLKGSPEELAKKFQKNIVTIEAERKEILKEINSLRSEWANFFVVNEKRLSKEIEKAEAPLKFAESRKTAIITGWIPEESYQEVFEKLNEVTQTKVFIECLNSDGEHEVPIKLKHSQPVKSFEWFMDLYSLPNYAEIDPTLFMFVTFPIFFGFMLGDIGYGLVTLALFIFLRSKIPEGRFLLNAMILSSLFTIAFGLAYGEFFGLEEIGHFELPHLLSRTHEINTLLIIAVSIGAFHVTFGLVMGFINELHHGFKRALLEKGSWLIMEAGIAVLALSLAKILPLHWATGAIIAGLGAVMLFFGEGIKGVIELPTLFSHMLSYARLMAVGLASVFLAVVVNEYSLEFIHQGGAMIVVGILIMIIGHIINIALGIIGPFLHSLRLHYVEFFTKFYKGGGKKYAPFGAQNQEV